MFLSHHRWVGSDVMLPRQMQMYNKTLRYQVTSTEKKKNLSNCFLNSKLMAVFIN